MKRNLWRLLVAAWAGAACTTGGSGPNDPDPPEDLVPVSVVVFYDENDNGVQDATEVVRIPGAEVLAGSQRATTTAGGRATLQVRRGPASLSLNPRSLPAFYQPGAPASVQAPATGEVLLAAKLPLGPNAIRNKYLPFGDSLTTGVGSTDGQGYRPRLASRLRAHFGAATVVDEGQPGTRSDAGARRVEGALGYARPAYTLILYGTNDWNEQACKDDRFPCYTIDSLRFMIREAKFVGSVPFIGTIPPVNTAINDFRAPQDRNNWVARINPLIKSMAASEGAVVVDLHAAFLAAGGGRDLFADHIHPSDRGYDIITDEFFKAITQPAPGGTAASGVFGTWSRLRESPSLLPGPALRAR